MAKRRGSKSDFQIRRVGSKEDRKRPSVFMRLKTDEAFKGVALFEPDPELAENPGYFEYYDHYDKQANQYVPCAGDKCPFCAANDNPSTRALTVWYFPQAADVKDKIKVFTMNYSTINDITDEAEDEDGILGKVVRIKRLSDKGDYKVKITSDKQLTKKELAAALKELAEKFPEGLVALVERQLKAQMERLKALDAMDDDDDEEEETNSKSRRGRAADDDEEDDDEEDEDEEEEDEEDEDEEDEEDEDEETEGIEEEEFEILKVSKAKNTITVEHDGEQIVLQGDDDNDVSGYKKGDSITVSAEYDEDEETWTITSISSDEEEEEDEEGEDEEAEDDDEISGGAYEVVRTNDKDEWLDLKNADGKLKGWVGQGLDVDYDEIKKGVKVKIDATKDDEGDWIITKLTKVKK